jgi:hypothetical protein
MGLKTVLREIGWVKLIEKYNCGLMVSFGADYNLYPGSIIVLRLIFYSILIKSM